VRERETTTTKFKEAHPTNGRSFKKLPGEVCYNITNIFVNILDGFSKYHYLFKGGSWALSGYI